jgi:hypothetical protein
MRPRRRRGIHACGRRGVYACGVSVRGVGGQATGVDAGCLRGRRGGKELVKAGRFYFVTLREAETQPLRHLGMTS